MRPYQRLLLACVAIAGSFLVIYQEFNPTRKVAPIHYYVARVVATDCRINGQVVHLALDTGSNATRISKVEADRLGLKVTPIRNNPIDGISESVYLTLCGRTFLAPIVAENYASNTADGFISWPAVSDNILVFDPARHLISSVPQLPSPTAGWLKLKVRNAEELELEVPLPNGTTGIILVDTGSPLGIDLPPAQWNAWRAAHPQAIITTRPYKGPTIGNGTTEEAWADKIQLGPLLLTDLPVRKAPPGEDKGYNNLVGMIGLYGLTRMDLVVDAKNDVAYLHPRDPPGPPYPPYQRRELTETLPGLPANGNWQLDQNVRTNPAGFFVIAAQLEFKPDDFQPALADLDHAIEIDPNYAEAYSSRGIIKEAQNDFAGALIDLTRGIELDPHHSEQAYSDRGFINELQGNFEAALADYTKAVDLHSTLDVVYLRRQVLLLRLHHPAEDLTQIIAKWNNQWDKTLGQFLAGTLNEEQLQTAMAKGSATIVPARQCETEYFIGMHRLLNGDATGAREHWQKAADIKIRGFNPYQLCARAELQRLDAVSQ